jgi:hypothetical protein
MDNTDPDAADMIFESDENGNPIDDTGEPLEGKGSPGASATQKAVNDFL